MITYKIKTVLRIVIIVYVVLTTIAAVVLPGMIRRKNQEIRRLEGNQESLMSEIQTYRTEEGEWAASTKALTLKVDEYEDLCEAQADKIKSLGLKVRRLQSVAEAVTVTMVDTMAPIRRDTSKLEPLTTPSVPVTMVEWSDPWVSLSLVLSGEDAQVKVTSVDTLLQVVHRVPKRFLCIPYGTKGIRQEIVSSNPHTKVVYTEYIELEGRKKRK